MEFWLTNCTATIHDWFHTDRLAVPMKLSRTLTMSVLVVAAVGAGAGTAVAAPPNAGFDPSQPLLTPTAESNSQAALMLFPGNDPKQAAFDTMANEVNIGWNNGGLQSTLIGANLASESAACRSSRTSSPAASSVESSARLPESAQESPTETRTLRRPSRSSSRLLE